MLKREDRQIAKRLMSYFKPHVLHIGIIILLSIILGSVPVALVKYIKDILDHIFIAKDKDLLTLVCMGIVVVFFVNAIAKYFQDLLIRYVSEAVSRQVRNRLYEKFSSMSFNYYVKNKLGVMLSKVINDVVLLNDGLTAITILAKDPIAIIGLTASAFYLDWKLMSISLILAPILGIMFAVMGKKVQGYTKRSLEGIADITSVLNETFSGIRIIKAFLLEKKMNEKFQHHNLEYFKVRIKTAKVEVLTSPLTEVIGVVVAAFMLFYGGMQVINGHTTPGSFFAFLASVGLILDPLRKINIANIRMNSALAGAKRIFEVLDFDEKIYSSKNPQTLNKFTKNIEFKNVCFAYDNTQVLSNISFTVNAGKSVAFVGSSGSGKTTLVNLLPRFYDAISGDIFIDGTSIKEFSLNSLRSKIALVTQETFLFNDSIYNNILYGKPEASRDEVIKASKAANSDEFIQDLPNGYESKLGDRGMNLSGGQRQRLAIARALLSNAPILILDEATSALDSESERLVQIAIERLMVGRTTFMIAHRLSTIKNADEIIILKDGRMVESGSHETLIKKQGAYYQFHKIQESPI